MVVGNFIEKNFVAEHFVCTQPHSPSEEIKYLPSLPGTRPPKQTESSLPSPLPTSLAAQKCAPLSRAKKKKPLKKNPRLHSTGLKDAVK